MIKPALKKEIERLVHKRSPQFMIKLMAKLLAEKSKDKKNDNFSKHPGLS